MSEVDTSKEAVEDLIQLIRHNKVYDQLDDFDVEAYELSEVTLAALLAERDAVYAAGFEACRDMAVDEMIKAAPKFGPEGPDSAELYGEDRGFGACVQIIRALQPDQKDSPND